MTAAKRLEDAKRIFLDTAPVIYYVEENGLYLPILEKVFERLDAGLMSAVTSPITLAESLVLPFKNGRLDLAEAFSSILTLGPGVLFVSIERESAEDAARLRARYGLTLTDALQAAIALSSKCDVFLSNDADVKRIRELNVVVLADVIEGR